MRRRFQLGWTADRPAAEELTQLDVGAMPICGEDNRLKGILTDRDIVVKVIAEGKDPAQTTAGEIADQDEVVTIGADDSVDEALRTMTSKKVRRLPERGSGGRRCLTSSLGSCSRYRRCSCSRCSYSWQCCSCWRCCVCCYRCCFCCYRSRCRSCC